MENDPPREGWESYHSNAVLTLNEREGRKEGWVKASEAVLQWGGKFGIAIGESLGQSCKLENSNISPLSH